MTTEQIRKQFNNTIRSKFIAEHSICQYCGKTAQHIHHIIPIHAGGDNRESNLIALCTECHGKIHNRMFLNSYNEEWKEKQRIGIEKAKSEGKFRGRQIKKISKNTYIELKNKYQTRQINKGEFAQQLGVSRPTLNNILNNESAYIKDFNKE